MKKGTRINVSFLKYLVLAVLSVMLLAGGAQESHAASGGKIESVHPYYYTGKMRKTVKKGGTKIRKGKKVTVVKNGRQKTVIIYSRKKYTVPSSAVELTGLATRGRKPYSVETAEAFVNRRGFGSKTSYLIWVSTYTQHLYVFRGRRHHWKVIRHITCSTGRFRHETPICRSTINRKAKTVWFNQDVGQGGYYALRIRGGYIHSWLYNLRWDMVHGRKLLWNRERYGSPASKGCVRVKIDFAKWLYKKIPIKTTNITY